MAKLKLVSNPQFKAKVPIPVAGADAVDVEMVFKHRTKTELDAFINSRAEVPDLESFLLMVDGWELEDAFTKENAELLLEHHIGAALATYRTYVEQLVQAKIKN